VTGACECGNESSGSIKFGDFFFFLLAEELLAFQEGHCSMELINVHSY